MNKALMVISLLVLLCFTFSCQQAGEGITEEEAKVLFNKGYEMWNEGNMDIVDEIIAPEYVIYSDPHDTHGKKIFCDGNDHLPCCRWQIKRTLAERG